MIEVAEEAREPADQFIRLAAAFFRAIADGDGRMPASYREVLRDDRPLEQVNVQRARDALRGWIRAIPEVRAAENALHGGANEAELARAFEQSRRHLAALRRELEAHRESFRLRRNYPSILDWAANGIGGWLA